MVALPAQAVIDADGKAAQLTMELIKERIEGQLKQKEFSELFFYTEAMLVHQKVHLRFQIHPGKPHSLLFYI